MRSIYFTTNIPEKKLKGREKWKKETLSSEESLSSTPWDLIDNCHQNYHHHHFARSLELINSPAMTATKAGKNLTVFLPLGKERDFINQ